MSFKAPISLFCFVAGLMFPSKILPKPQIASAGHPGQLLLSACIDEPLLPMTLSPVPHGSLH